MHVYTIYPKNINGHIVATYPPQTYK